MADNWQAGAGFSRGGVDEADLAALVAYARQLGATDDELARAQHLGELVLDLHLRPRGTRTLQQVVTDGGIEWELAERLLGAMGLGVAPDDRLTDDEVATVELLCTVGRDVLGEDATAQLARVAGMGMARIAETIVATFRLQFELPRRDAGTRSADVIREYASITDTLLPAFVRALDVVLRREIVAVAERMWSTDDERSAVTLPRTVGFVDLVGYTAAAETMSVRELTSVLATFDEATARVVQSGGGQIVKTIGDEALFVAEDASDACRIAVGLVERFGGDDLPPVRVGLASGEVISVFGDVFGPYVNLAARLVGAAEPSTVLASTAVRAACVDDFAFGAGAEHALKGFAAPVTAYVLLGPRV